MTTALLFSLFLVAISPDAHLSGRGSGPGEHKVYPISEIESSRVILGDSVSPKTTVNMVSSGRIFHRFFDTSPLSPSGRYLALFRSPFEDRAPKPGEAGEVVLVDMKTGNERVVATSKGWEMQLGANVQWGATDNELYFNDVDPATWQAFAVQLNPFTGKAKRMAGTVFMVSADGKKLASYNLISSRYAQVGYGVVLPEELTPRNTGPVATDGVYITDVATNQTKMLVSIKDVYEKTVPSIAISNPQDYEYYFFQVKWNPQGTKLLTTVQWTPKSGGQRKRSVITMNADGSDIRTAITNEQWSKGGHHINWTPDGDHLSMNLNVDGKPGLEIITVKADGSEMKVVYPKGSGHPSFHPKGLPFIITDAYFGEMTTSDGKEPLRLINVADGTEETIVTVLLSDNPNFELRVDAHPAWDKSGRYMIFNGYAGHTRNVYIVDLKKLLKVSGRANR
jgi:hypothetical protein